MVINRVPTMKRIGPSKEFEESTSQDYVPFSFRNRQLSIILEEDTLGNGRIEHVLEEGKKKRECSPTSSSSIQIINKAKKAIAEAKQQRLKSSSRVKLCADPQRDDTTQANSASGKSVLKRYIESRVQPKLECPVEKEKPEVESRSNHKHNKKSSTVPTISCDEETGHRSEEELKEFVGRLRREYQLTMMHSKNNDPKAMKALHDFFHLCDKFFQQEKIRENNLLR
ncbi:predicted protein [Chaetoceros tenuissimus]|uniref:Uncharacterized protein n=1 Tax=Chaetoceros tenuissimus TaxID=426638 RepID=A0AAD3H2K8_9STRA|nr:predicted protein [Chaetoceros tenuissimus]